MTHREFNTGATRDTNKWKLQYSKYIHPLADYSFAEYMKSKQVIWWEHREGDNRQKGIPEESLFDSLVRHIEILKLLKKWHQVKEIKHLDWKIDLIIDEEVPSNDKWKIVVLECENKTIEGELNAIRFNGEALKLYYIKWWYG